MEKGRFVPYPININAIIELAYSKSTLSATWEEEYDNEINKKMSIDLAQMYEANDRDRTNIEVRRRDLGDSESSNMFVLYES